MQVSSTVYAVIITSRYVTSEEQECSTMESADGKYAVPFVVLGKAAAEVFKKRRGRDRLVEMLPDQRVSWKKGTPTKEDNQQFWRKYLQPNPKSSANSHYDCSHYQLHKFRFLLAGRPQIGKTGTYIEFIRLLSSHIKSAEPPYFRQ